MSVTPSFPLITRRHLFRQTKALLAVSVIGDFPPLQAQSTANDEIAKVKSAEVAFNAAQNAGNIEGMFKLSLPDRTVYGSAGGALVEGWTDESKKRRHLAPDGNWIIAMMPVEEGEGQKAQNHVIFLENFFDEVRRRTASQGK